MDSIELGKVIKGLECCGGISSAYECPYQGSEGCNNCRGNIYLDALALLKEQEPVKPFFSSDRRWLCSNCMREVEKYGGDYYCPGCGRKLLWE